MKEILEKKLNSNSEIKKIFERIFEVEEYQVNLVDPRAKEIFSQFLNQKITIIRNKILKTETIFNYKRGKRHLPQGGEIFKDDYDPFCNGEAKTINDELGRMENQSAKIVANISKMAPFHSVLFFKKHELDDLTEKDFLQALELANDWFKKVREKFQTKIGILIWNFHYRAGASIYHPHFQLLSYYHLPSKFENLIFLTENYRQTYNTSYFDDLFMVLEFLGLAKKENDFKIWLNLTPIKQNEINFEGKLEKANGEIFWSYFQKLKKIAFQSFNLLSLAFISKLPNLTFLVDREEPSKIASDFGSLEVFMNSVVSYNPFDLAEQIFNN